MWLAEGTGEWISGVETVMSVHLKTRHQPRTSALVNRSDAVHGLVVLTHTSHVVISSGQAGHARALTTTRWVEVVETDCETVSGINGCLFGE